MAQAFVGGFLIAYRVSINPDQRVGLRDICNGLRPNHGEITFATDKERVSALRIQNNRGRKQRRPPEESIVLVQLNPSSIYACPGTRTLFALHTGNVTHGTSIVM
uniref:Uncharacterized protein n=1 Tax=Fusarium oxysporum (strain Fo5176) TaxID=660025 RepID=A0A0C4BL40_FUSOF